ncbi:MAG: class I SAM-dependent methyltransferase [Candidatus Thorarchaeota archaeon]|jgi:ubiquinone/menaquinone biosynthesis C-methylase UbiE
MVSSNNREAPLDRVRSIYSSTAQYYAMILRTYRILGVDLQKWRLNAISGLPNLKRPRILDVGVGTGANLHPLIKKYPDYAEIVGVDYTPEMLARAKKRVKEQQWSNVSLVHLDAREMASHIQGNFDLIISTYSLSIIPDSLRVLAEIRELSSAQGFILLLDCQKFKGPLRIFNPMAIFLSTRLGGTSETYAVPVSETASQIFQPVRRKLLYSGLFYEDVYRLRR